MVVLLVFAALVSLIAGVFILRWGAHHAKTYGSDMPQRFHVADVPRIGGLGMLAALLLAWLLMAVGPLIGLNHNVDAPWSFAWPWMMMLLPAVLGGIWEDLTQRVGVKWRLAMSMASALLACLLMNLYLPRLGLPGVDTALATWPLLGMAIAVVAIGGLPHAFNIIDGYNGLAATVALLVSLALAHVANQLGDRQLAALLLCLAGSTAGFLAWNYPKGLIFAGDGGAYLWGVVIAAASIALVQRHEEVSPWFPMLLLIYPVWETVFSIYRKTARGDSPGMADALHFHQLIYRRLVRGVFDDDASRRMLARNNRTSPWLWSFTLLTVIPAVVFWNNDWVLMGFCLLFAVSYVVAYFTLVRFKVPRWLGKRKRTKSPKP